MEVAARRVVQEHSEINALDCPTPPKTPFEIVSESSRLSNREGTAENENPGALAGATGADVGSFWTWFDLNITRAAAASALVDAVVGCHPEDRVPLLERLLEELRPGWPQVPFLCGVMEEAGFWADMASRVELKAYCLASYQRMTPADQAAFLGYVQGRDAA